VDFDLPKDVWFEGTSFDRGNITEFLVVNAILGSEVTQLKAIGLTGNGTNLQLALEDQARVSDVVQTEFNVKYKITRSDPQFRSVSDLKTIYEGNISQDLIGYNNNRFILNIGKLPIPPEYLKGGLGVEIELTAKRGFAGKTAEQRIIFRGVISNFG
jgi:hypothetical protein